MANPKGTTTEDRADTVQRLMASVAAGVEALVSGDDWKRTMAFQSAFHRYSFNNVLLIVSQMPGASRVASYKRWSDLGRQVRQGEKALKILAPVTGKKTVEKADGTAEDKSFVWFKTVPVFDVSQTDGDPLPGETDVRLVGDDAGVLATLTAYATDVLGYAVVTDFLGNPALGGFVSFSEKKIVLSAASSPLHRAKTLAHEIGHVVLHSGDFADMDAVHEKPVREVEAESFAFCLMSHFGADTAGYSFDYVAGWAKGDAKVVKQVAGRIQKAVTKVLGHFDDLAEIARLRAENQRLRLAA